MNYKKTLLFLVLFLIVGVPAFGALNSFIYQQKQARPTNVMMGRQAALMQTQDSYAPTEVQKISVGRTEPAVGIAADVQTTIMPVPPVDSGFVPGEDRTIVKTANLSIVVGDTRQAVERANQIAKEANGLVSSSNVYESPYDNGNVRADMIIRVPVDKLEDTLAKVKEMASKVLTDSISADDRTKQKVDLEARIKNLKASEDQLVAIMRQAKTVQETLEVQRQLTEVRGQIEIMTAQLENLQGDAAMSTINLSISTKESELPTVGGNQNSVLDEVKLALKDAVRFYRNLFIAGIRLTIIFLPLLVLGVVSWFIWKRKARKS